MAANEEEEGSGFTRWIFKVLAILILVCVGIGVAGYFLESKVKDKRADEHRDAVAETFSPVLEALREAEKGGRIEPEGIDVDRTVRVLHEMDLALENASSVEEYVSLLSKQDYRGVDPAVLTAREEVLDILFRLYETQSELDEQEAAWGFARRWMGLLSFTKAAQIDGRFAVGGGIAETPSVELDTSSIVAELEDAEGERNRLVQELRSLQTELVDANTRHSKVYWDVLDEWDRLCLHRDRAYLAAYKQDWAAAAEAADAAIAMAPHEKEAHLLKALAMIESGEAANLERDEVGELLADYVRRHPGASAPALLLQGVNEARRGNGEEARLLFEQSSANYPRQADLLGELLDPYRVRTAYLRKSRSGNSIRELYKATMLGAAWFSPELQTAKLDFEAGDFETGKKRVMDHFARRRSQAQWDLIVYDVYFCEELLGDYFPQIFPEDVYLDLEIDPTFFGNRYELAIRNRSDRTLHNATLILCLQFTDMHTDDYETFASETQPDVEAHETTDFGEMEITMDLYGLDKDREDVYAQRAIVVSNEAVVWVDTIDFKYARMPRVPKGATNVLVEKALGALDREITLEIDSERFFDDDVTIVLPREISILKPVFRLRYGTESYRPEENLIEGGSIRLRFDGVAEFEGVPEDDLVLEVHGALISFELRWKPEEGGGYRFDGVKRGG